MSTRVNYPSPFRNWDSSDREVFISPLWRYYCGCVGFKLSQQWWSKTSNSSGAGSKTQRILAVKICDEHATFFGNQTLNDGSFPRPTNLMDVVVDWYSHNANPEQLSAEETLEIIRELNSFIRAGYWAKNPKPILDYQI